MSAEQEEAKARAHYLAGGVEGVARRIHNALLSENYDQARQEFTDLENIMLKLADSLNKLQ